MKKFQSCGATASIFIADGADTVSFFTLRSPTSGNILCRLTTRHLRMNSCGCSRHPSCCNGRRCHGIRWLKAWPEAFDADSEDVPVRELKTWLDFRLGARRSGSGSTQPQRKRLVPTVVMSLSGRTQTGAGVSVTVEFLGLQQRVSLCMDSHEDEEEYRRPRNTHLSDGQQDVLLNSHVQHCAQHHRERERERETKRERQREREREKERERKKERKREKICSSPSS